MTLEQKEAERDKVRALSAKIDATANKGPYKPITLVLDHIGCLHMFAGDVHPTGRDHPKVNGREAVTFIQRQEDIEGIMEYLTDDEQENLSGGNPVRTTYVPDYYIIPVQS